MNIKNILLSAVAVLAISGAAHAADFNQEAALAGSNLGTLGGIVGAAHKSSKDTVNAVQTNGTNNTVTFEQQGGGTLFRVPLANVNQKGAVVGSNLITVGLIAGAGHTKSYGSANVIGTTGVGNSVTVKKGAVPATN